MASMELQGWTLGISECIGLIIFIGFSVDYIVHMCHQYIESAYTDRKNRMEACYFQMGSTILNGAFTSFVAGLILFRCYIRQSTQFGILMMITIVTALIVALVFFP